jgi:uncharacterized delta-60 repeat protein
MVSPFPLSLENLQQQFPMKRTLSIIALALILTGQSFAQILQLDSTFAQNGLANQQVAASQLYLRKTVRLPDGKYLACAYGYHIVENANYIEMWRVNACGGPDSTFGQNGFLKFTFEQRNSGEDFLIQEDGKIVVVGSQAPNNFSSQQKPFIARFHSNGVPDSTFGTFGTQKISDAFSDVFSFTSLYPMAGGKYLVSGGRNFMRFLPNANRDTTFGTNGAFTIPRPQDVIGTDEGQGHLVNDSTIWVAINNRFPNFIFKLGIYALKTSGKVDSSFGNQGVFIENIANIDFAGTLQSVVQSDGKMVVATTQTDQGVRLVRIMYPGEVDSTFGQNGFVFIPGFRLNRLSLLSGNRLLVSYSDQAITGSLFRLLDANELIQNNFRLREADNPQPQNLRNGYVVPLYEGPNSEWVFTAGFNHLTMLRAVPESISAMPHILQNGILLNAQVADPTASFQWFRNGQLLTGASAETLQISQTGTYKVIVTTTRGCTAEDEFIVSTLVGAADVTISDPWQLFPNPTSAQLTLSGPEPILGIRILDMLGQEVFVSFEEGKTIDVQHLAKGCYGLQIQTANGLWVKRWMKE